MAAANNTSPQNADIPIFDDTTIHITKNTVKFGSDVYQFRNVTGFGKSLVKTPKVPFQWILGLFVIGLIGANYADNRFAGIVILMVATILLLHNILTPQKYGLKLYLNSGAPLPIFVTTDIDGLKGVVSVLYDFMESNEEGSYVVYSTDRSIKIEGSVGGNFIGRDAMGDVSNKR